MMEDRFWNLDSLTLLCCYFSSFTSACEWELLQDLDQAWSMVKSPLCWFSIKQHHSTANFELRNKRCHCHCSLDLICFSPQSNLLCFLWNRVCSKSPDQLNTREWRRIWINPDDQHHNVIEMRIADNWNHPHVRWYQPGCKTLPLFKKTTFFESSDCGHQVKTSPTRSDLIMLWRLQK